MHLYDIAAEYSALVDALVNAESDEERACIVPQLAVAKDAISEKFEVYTRIMKNLQAEVDGLDAEISRLEKLKKSRNAAIENFKGTILFAMKETNTAKVKTSIGTWSLRTNPFKVTITDLSAVPERFLIPQPPVADKRALLNEFKETGEVFPGCEFDRAQSASFR